MTRTYTVRADEIRTGDTTAVRGVVGTVVDVIRYGGTLPRVDVTIRTEWGTVARDVFAPASPVVVEVPN